MKDIKHLRNNFIKVVLKTGSGIRKIEGYNLEIEVTISDTQKHLQFINFSNSYLLISTNEVQLDKLLKLI